MKRDGALTCCKDSAKGLGVVFKGKKGANLEMLTL